MLGPSPWGPTAPGSPPLPCVSVADSTDVLAQALHKDTQGLKASRWCSNSKNKERRE